MGRRAGNDERVVVAWNGENGTRIVAERLIELVVVVLRFSKIVDDIAEVKKKGGLIGLVRTIAIDGYLVREPSARCCISARLTRRNLRERER